MLDSYTNSVTKPTTGALPETGFSDRQLALFETAECGSPDNPDPVPQGGMNGQEITETVKNANLSRYCGIICHVFLTRFENGREDVCFDRDAIKRATADLDLTLPENIGDVTYAYRNRKPLPELITSTAPDGFEWTLGLAGHSRHAFTLRPINDLEATDGLEADVIRDQTPEWAGKTVTGRVARLDLIVRSNSLVSRFLGIDATYVQSGLRTTVPGVGQIELSSLYVENCAEQVGAIVPVHLQSDVGQLNTTKTMQNMRFAGAKFENRDCRAVIAQQLEENKIGLFELEREHNMVHVVREQHFLLVN